MQATTPALADSATRDGGSDVRISRPAVRLPTISAARITSVFEVADGEG
jgi:hypothetical protein